MLLESGATLGIEDGQLRTPLLLACESAAFDAVRVLVDAGAPIQPRDKSDMTPLHWLAFHGNKTMVELVLSKKVEVDPVNYASQTPLWFAVTKGHLSTAIALVDGLRLQSHLECRTRFTHFGREREQLIRHLRLRAMRLELL